MIMEVEEEEEEFVLVPEEKMKRSREFGLVENNQKLRKINCEKESMLNEIQGIKRKLYQPD